MKTYYYVELRTSTRIEAVEALQDDGRFIFLGEHERDLLRSDSHLYAEIYQEAAQFILDYLAGSIANLAGVITELEEKLEAKRASLRVVEKRKADFEREEECPF